MAREHQKSVSSQKRHDAQLKASQQSAGAQIDARCDVNLAGIDDKVKRIIKDTVKSQSIKKEALSFDISSLTKTNDFSGFGNLNNISSGNVVPPPSQFGPANKRMRQQENAINLRSPPDSNRKKKSNFKAQAQFQPQVMQF